MDRGGERRMAMRGQTGQRKAPPADRGELHAGGGSRCYTTILRVVTHVNPGLRMKFRCMEKSFAELDRAGKPQVSRCITGGGNPAKERRGNSARRRTANPSTTRQKKPPASPKPRLSPRGRARTWGTAHQHTVQRTGQHGNHGCYASIRGRCVK